MYTRPRNLLYTLIGKAAFILMIGTVATVTGRGQSGPNGKDANAANTSNVNVVNTPNVNVNNPVTLSAGTSVGVIASEANPVIVREQRSAVQIFQFSTSTSSSGVIAVTVPTGKRLIVEFISGEQSVPNGSGQGIFTARVTTQSGIEIFRHFVLSSATDPRGTFTDYYASQPVQMYLVAGEQLRILFNADAFSSVVNVTGHYVDAP